MATILQKVELYEIPLLKGLGYFYAKVLYFHLEEFDNTQIIVRVYDSYHKDPMHKTKGQINKEIFQTDNYYTYPFRLWGKPRKRGKHKWYFIQEMSICECDKVIPDFSNMTLDEEKGKGNDNDGIAVEKNLEGHKLYPNIYKNTKHLISSRITYDDYVRIYITFLWFIEKDFKDELNEHPRDGFSPTLIKKVIKDNFTLKEYSNVVFHVVFNDIERRRSYQTIPKEIRDKAIEFKQ